MTTSSEPGEVDDRKTDPPPSLEEQLLGLEAAFAESNRLSEASRQASERCSNLTMQLLSEVRVLAREQGRHHTRLRRLEELAGVPHAAE